MPHECTHSSHCPTFECDPEPKPKPKAKPTAGEKWVLGAGCLDIDGPCNLSAGKQCLDCQRNIAKAYDLGRESVDKPGPDDREHWKQCAKTLEAVLEQYKLAGPDHKVYIFRSEHREAVAELVREREYWKQKARAKTEPEIEFGYWWDRRQCNGFCSGLGFQKPFHGQSLSGPCEALYCVQCKTIARAALTSHHNAAKLKAKE